MSHLTDTSNGHSYNETDSTESSIALVKINIDSKDMEDIFTKIHAIIKSLGISMFMDESFMISMIDSDIHSNIEFYKIRDEKPSKIFVLLDPLNNLFLPFETFTTVVIPTYLGHQIHTAFSDITSIRSILDSIASTLQDDIEHMTLAASEEEFKNAKFNKKDIPNDTLNDILLCHTVNKRQSESLNECPLCGIEKVNHYYECVNCQYKYCYDCCKEIASRQALCPCCREELSLIECVQ